MDGGVGASSQEQVAGGGVVPQAKALVTAIPAATRPNDIGHGDKIFAAGREPYAGKFPLCPESPRALPQAIGRF
jgi:hypothetical protein